MHCHMKNTKMLKMTRLSALLLILFLLAGCNLPGDPTSPPVPQPVAPGVEPPTPTPIPPPELRGDLEIQQLMIQSHTFWKSLQANAVISLFPPSGTNAEAQNTSVQVWIEQPGKARVIAGPPDEAPNHVFVSDGQTARLNNDPIQPLPPSVLETFVAPTALTDSITPYPLSGYLGTPVSDLIFPTGLAQRGGEYRLVGKESAAGREAYLVEWGRAPGELIDRFWVDTQTGVILRHQSYGKEDSTTPVSDIRLTAVQYDLDLPDDLFKLDDPSLPALATPQPTLDPAAAQLAIRPDLTLVNVRGGPGTTYPVIGGLYPKQVVRVVGKSQAGDWWAIDLEGQTGWVFAELVDFSGDPASVPVLPAP
jgi:outer membrane lipoprotein-sorting protein